MTVMVTLASIVGAIVMVVTVSIWDGGVVEKTKSVWTLMGQREVVMRTPSARVRGCGETGDVQRTTTPTDAELVDQGNALR